MSNQLICSITRELSRQHRFGFTFQDVVGEFPDVNPVYLTWILSEMVQKGILKIIFRNNYHIFPFNADPETSAPDGHQVAKTIIQN